MLAVSLINLHVLTIKFLLLLCCGEYVQRVKCLWRPGEGVGTPGATVAGSSELGAKHGYVWQYMVLTTEPSISSL